MSDKIITIKDIAKAVNISVSTVSRALRNSHDVSNATKTKVLAVAKKMGYQPNPIALALRNRKTLTIGVVVSEIANAFFSQVINGVEKVAKENNYNVVVIQTNDDVENEKKAINFLASRSIDGIIISLSATTQSVQHIQEVIERGVPIVQFDKINTSLHTPYVSLNNSGSTYEACKLLLQKGINSLVVVAGNKKSSIINDRVAGIIEAVNNYSKGKQKMKVEVLYCSNGGWDVSEVETQLAKLKTLTTDKLSKTAIIAITDRLTYATAYSLRQLLPIANNKVIVAGFSNADYVALLEPPMFIIQQPANSMGITCCHFLLQLLKKNNHINNGQHKVFNAVYQQPTSK